MRNLLTSIPAAVSYIVFHVAPPTKKLASSHAFLERYEQWLGNRNCQSLQSSTFGIYLPIDAHRRLLSGRLQAGDRKQQEDEGGKVGYLSPWTLQAWKAFCRFCPVLWLSIRFFEFIDSWWGEISSGVPRRSVNQKIRTSGNIFFFNNLKNVNDILQQEKTRIYIRRCYNRKKKNYLS